MRKSTIVHRAGRKCATEARFPYVAAPPPRHGVQPEIVVDVHRGKIPLWAPNTTLHWRFDRKSLRRHENADIVERRVRRLLHDAIAAWEDSAPIAFVENDDWDFEISVLKRRDCDEDGCTLASAFFPDSGRQRLLVYPTNFDYDLEEQVATMAHEVGHVFGLRHFFADTDPDEKNFPSMLFGKQSRFTIMNYGYESRLTEADRNDLRRLYEAAWSDDPQAPIGRPVRLLHAHHSER